MNAQEAPEGYQDLVVNTGRLFVKRKTPDWSPDSEHPLAEVKLINEVLVDVDIDPNPQYGFSISAHYPEGSVTEPASHFIEHMLTSPRGIGYLPDRLSNTGISYEGSTSPNYTNFSLSIDRLNLFGLHKDNPLVLSDLIYLLYGMTVIPDINNEVVERERRRIATEMRGRQDNTNNRLYDYLMPLVILGRHFCLPTPETELSFTTDQLNAIHRRRQNNTIELGITGNPQKEKLLDEIAGVLNKTFGQLPVSGETIKPSLPIGLFEYGKKIHVLPSYGLANDYIGLTIVNKEEGAPEEKLAQRAFIGLLEDRVHALLRQLAYVSFTHDLNFKRSVYRAAFIGITTQRLSEADNVLRSVVDELVVGGQSKVELEDLFESRRNGAVYSLFREPTLRRVDMARNLGFSTERNSADLYQAMKDLSLERVLDVGSRTFSPEMIGMLHYGQTTDGLEGFQEVNEEDLIKVWKETK